MTENVIPFDRPRKRRFTRATASSKTEFELISVRLPAEAVRRMDEIVAARSDPQLKTRSDVINDAVHSWLEIFFTEHGDELPRLADQFRLEQHAWLHSARAVDFNMIQENFDQAVAERNTALFTIILYNAYRLKADLEHDPYGSPVQKTECAKLIQKITKEMES